MLACLLSYFRTDYRALSLVYPRRSSPCYSGRLSLSAWGIDCERQATHVRSQLHGGGAVGVGRMTCDERARTASLRHPTTRSHTEQRELTSTGSSLCVCRVVIRSVVSIHRTATSYSYHEHSEHRHSAANRNRDRASILTLPFPLSSPFNERQVHTSGVSIPFRALP
jgi:hypothetical protein